MAAKATQRLASRLRFPHLFWLVVALFVIDLLVPDFIPFADEILLGVLAVLLGSLRDGRNVPEPHEGEQRVVIDVTPERD